MMRHRRVCSSHGSMGSPAHPLKKSFFPCQTIARERHLPAELHSNRTTLLLATPIQYQLNLRHFHSSSSSCSWVDLERRVLAIESDETGWGEVKDFKHAAQMGPEAREERTWEKLIMMRE